MKIVFLGSTNLSLEILNFLFEKNFQVSAVFGSPKNFNISYSKGAVNNINHADLEIVAKKRNVPFFEVDSVDGKRLVDYKDIFLQAQADVILAVGWYYMIPDSIRKLARYGAWGVHASLLPNYAGGAPLVWAIIEGCQTTGVTLFRMDDGVDSGDIILQKHFEIDFSDTIKDVYAKATLVSKNILEEVLGGMKEITFTPQDKTKVKVYPQRSPEDGEIDFTKSAVDIYNFIRAQCSPYPGAFFKTKDGRKIVIESVRIE